MRKSRSLYCEVWTLCSAATASKHWLHHALQHLFNHCLFNSHHTENTLRVRAAVVVPILVGWWKNQLLSTAVHILISLSIVVFDTFASRTMCTAVNPSDQRGVGVKNKKIEEMGKTTIFFSLHMLLNFPIFHTFSSLFTCCWRPWTTPPKSSTGSLTVREVIGVGWNKCREI